MSAFTESVVEEATLAWLESTGWRVVHGPDIAPDMPAAERADYGEVVLARRLSDALARLNHALPIEALADPHMPELQVVTEGLLARRRFLDLVRDFVVFEDEGGGRIAKEMAGYHQFHAVQVAVGETLRAAELARADEVAERGGRYEAGRKPGGRPGDRSVGVVWHTQGSRKSIEAAQVIEEPPLEKACRSFVARSLIDCPGEDAMTT